MTFTHLGKCDQLAIYVHNEDQRDSIKHLYGLDRGEWIKDNPIGRAQIMGWREQLACYLEFSNDLMADVELELITCSGDRHAYTLFDQWAMRQPFLAHIGFHVAGAEWPPIAAAPLVQEMWTESHTNPFLVKNGRRYHYRVYDTRPQVGVFTKLIKRVERDDQGD